MIHNQQNRPAWVSEILLAIQGMLAVGPLPFFTKKETLKILDVKPTKLHYLVKQGRLVVTYVNKKPYYLRESVIKLVMGQHYQEDSPTQP
jgi:hypothetical protein